MDDKFDSNELKDVSGGIAGRLPYVYCLECDRIFNYANDFAQAEEFKQKAIREGAVCPNCGKSRWGTGI